MWETKRVLKRCFYIILVLSFFSLSAQAQQSSLEMEQGSSASREFLMSCTYGVLAGTMVGLASLAFVDKPSENMQRVARGASLGLYTGILLGLYVVYVIPAMEDDSSDEDPIARLDKLSWDISPLINASGIEGLQARYTVLRW